MLYFGRAPKQLQLLIPPQKDDQSKAGEAASNGEAHP
jgi:hypothetical protein